MTLTLGFGKYRNTPIDEVPTAYLKRHVAWVKEFKDRPTMKMWVKELPRIKEILRARRKKKRTLSSAG